MNALQTQEILTALTLIAIAVIAAVRVGAPWLRLAFIDLLAAFLVKRIDTIGGLIGVSMVSDPVSDLVSFLAIATIIFAFAAARQRRLYLVRAERQRQSDLRQKHDPTIEYLEGLRRRDEKAHAHDWNALKPIKPNEKSARVWGPW